VSHRRTVLSDWRPHEPLGRNRTQFRAVCDRKQSAPYPLACSDRAQLPSIGNSCLRIKAYSTAAGLGPMSEMGQKRKSRRATGRSAFPSRTDIVRRGCQVRKVPRADIGLILLTAPSSLREEWNSMQITFRLGHAMEWCKFIVSFALRLRAPRIGTASWANAVSWHSDRLDR